MKFITIFWIGLFTSLSSQCIGQTIRIDLQNFNCDSLFVVVLDVESYSDTLFIDTITDGRFDIKKRITDYSIGAISITNICQEEGLSAPILLENEKIILEHRNQGSFSYLNYSGSNIQSEFNDYNQPLNDLRDEIFKTQKSIQAFTDSSDDNRKDSLKARLPDLYHNGSQIIIDSWRENPEEKFRYVLIPQALNHLAQNNHLKDSICNMAAQYAAPSSREQICYRERNILGKSIEEIINDENHNDHSHNDHSLEQFFESKKGKTVIMEFWASWCAPCMKDQKILASYQKEINGKNIAILSIAIKDSYDRAQNARDKSGANWKNILDEKNRFARLFQVGTIPKYYLFNEQGILVEITADLDKALATSGISH